MIDLSTVTTMQAVANTLEQLNAQLDTVTLRQFLLFNKAYLVVTHSIQQAIDEHYFQNPQFIEVFIVHFACHYFQAVNDTIRNDSQLASPWSKLNEYALQKSAPVFISLMLGANAHINNDLPQVLKQLMPSQETADLVGDILKIDKLLMKSGKEIISLFEEKNELLNFLKTRLQFTYYRPAMYTILYWRITAWKNYKKIKNDDTFMVTVARRSVGIAKRLLWVAKILS